MPISTNTRTLRRVVPNRGRPGGGQNPDTNKDLDVFVDVLGRPSSDHDIFTPVACGPATPSRPKDYPGLGDPNSLKIERGLVNKGVLENNVFLFV